VLFSSADLKLANRDALGLLFAQRNGAKTNDTEQRQNHEADSSYPTLFDPSGHPKPANDGHLKTGQRE
jgi:hypothetical protein